MNKQVVYVSVLINIIIVSFITGYLINSKNNESSEIIETKLTETTTNSESNLAETTNLVYIDCIMATENPQAPCADYHARIVNLFFLYCQQILYDICGCYQQLCHPYHK